MGVAKNTFPGPHLLVSLSMVQGCDDERLVHSVKVGCAPPDIVFDLINTCLNASER